jgi:hypothetical protein
LLKYIPAPNSPGNVFSTSAYSRILHDDKIGERVDADTRWGGVFGYYSMDNYTENNPYPTAQGGANVPGFNALYTGRAQLAVFGNTKTFGPTYPCDEPILFGASTSLKMAGCEARKRFAESLRDSQKAE